MNTPDESRLNLLADEFESAWQAGPPPNLAEFLARVDPEHEAALADLLLPIEIEYRLQTNQPIASPEYPQTTRKIFESLVGITSAQKREEALQRLCAANDQLLVKVRALFAAHTAASELFTVTQPPGPDLPPADGPGTTAPMALIAPAPSSWIGPYKLLQRLGGGGMGDVWMAEQEKPVRRRVALKLIKTGLDTKQVIARFEAERQALAIMDHQNIARILDAGTTPSGQPYFVMELVHGVPFTKYCDDQRLSIRERLELFIPVCNAVQHAHQKGIIHRDLKPSNVLVCLYDGKPVAKVIDFGLAKALQHQSRLTDKTLFTEFGQIVGTLQYMSPEQAELNQLDIDTRTDIYSLGVMLYELLTGSTPIERATLDQQAILKVLQTIREQDPLRPSARLNSSSQEAVSGISAQRRIDPAKLISILQGELDWIVMKSLEKDRTRRYETANRFSDDLTRYLTGDIVTARPLF